ncbi:MAG: MFS transporter [Anaerolineales bacterium]|nr:MFS transporter [Anaerolineales bacterium]
MTLILDQLFINVALGHFFVDLLNSNRTVLFTYWSKLFGFNNATLAMVSMIYVMLGALMQPLFGHLADRIGPSKVATLGVLWIGFFYALALLTPGIGALYLVLVASVGSASFHPAGVMQATLRGRKHNAGRETTSAAYFFLFGQASFMIGPILSGPFLDRFGSAGLAPFAALAILFGLFTLRSLKTARVEERFQASHSLIPSAQAQPLRIRVTAISLIAFLFVASGQEWVQQSLITFIPKYLSDLGRSATEYGVIIGLYMGGSMLGNLLGGYLADRFSKRLVIIGSLVLGSLPVILMGLGGGSLWTYLMAPVAGCFISAAYPIIVVMAQRMLPGGTGLATGLILGFLFSMGALGTWLSGHVADLRGVPFIFTMSAAITLSTGILAIFLREEPRPVQEKGETVAVESHGD